MEYRTGEKLSVTSWLNEKENLIDEETFILVRGVNVKPKITMVRTNANLNCEIDCKWVSSKLKNWRLTKTGCLHVKIGMVPSVTVTINCRGKLFCWGKRNIKMSMEASIKCAQVLSFMGYKVKLTDFKVDNLGAILKLPFRVKLEMMAKTLIPNVCFFEPEVSARMYFPLKKPRVHLWICHTGCVNAAGATNIEEIMGAFERIVPILEYFRVIPSSTGENEQQTYQLKTTFPKPPMGKIVVRPCMSMEELIAIDNSSLLSPAVDFTWIFSEPESPSTAFPQVPCCFGNCKFTINLKRL